jgi:hypothetical protein
MQLLPRILPRFYLNYNLLSNKACHHSTVVSAQRGTSKDLLRYGAQNITLDADPFGTNRTTIAHLSDRLSFQ